jgi:hypothetical protein
MSVTAIRSSLKALPDTLDETYERILLGIAPDHQEIAVAALNWLASSKARLTVKELSEAMIIRPDANTPFNIEDRLRNLHDVLRVLSSLVVIEDPPTFAGLVYDFRGSGENSSDEQEENGTSSETNYSEEDENSSESHYSEDIDSEIDDISLDSSSDSRESVDLDEESRIKMASSRIRLAHFSVLEYLVSTRILQGAASTFRLDTRLSNNMILKCCLHYITYCNINQSSTSTSKCFPLHFYASRWWPIHAKSVDDTVSLSLVCRCLTSKSWIAAWLKSAGTHRWNTIKSPTWSQSNEDDSLTQALFLAVELGIIGAIKPLIELGAEPNKRGRYGFDLPLAAAALQGNCQAIQELVKFGADISVKDETGKTAFHSALSSGQLDVVRFLLEKGQDVNVEGPNRLRPLHLALLGSRTMVQVLIENGAILDIDEIRRWHPSPQYKADFEVLLAELMTTSSQHHDVLADLLFSIWEMTEDCLYKPENKEES